MPARRATPQQTQDTRAASGPALPGQRAGQRAAGGEAAPAVGPHPDQDSTTIPRLPRVFVPRDRLWARLDEVTSGGVTLVVAPVGAGKTLGVAGWLRSDPRRVHARWVHADVTWTPERMGDLLASDDSPTQLLVIDDAHRLPNATLRLFDDRLNNDPESLRVVLLSRWDLPLTRLAAELLGHLSIVRGDVLRMHDAECAPLIAEHARTDHPDVVRDVTARAHGWAAAVVLASRAVAAAPDAVAAAHQYAGGQTNVADTLANEVFAALQPRERHLLLCVASEGTVSVEDAVHLSHDPTAGEILAGLEATGLLVSRMPPRFVPGAADEQPGTETWYRIHPLLSEVVRRRLVAGGVDVAQAQATIRRAVRLDLARGLTDHSFSRLVGANQPEEAARLLTEEGPTILMRGRGSTIAAFARAHPDTVEAEPGMWFTLGLERWLDNDATGAGHWLDRVLHEARDHVADKTLSPVLACAHLLRALLGSEPMAAAVGRARRVVLAQMRTSDREPLLPLLLAELGVAQGWLGDLTEAEVNLSTAVALGRARGLRRLTAAALSHLALTTYMQGHENACIELADEALEAAREVAWQPDYTHARALLVRELAQLCGVPSMLGGAPETPAVPILAGDPVTQFWASMRAARAALANGSVPTALQTLEKPMTWMELPEHLRVVVILERGYLASLSGDQQELKHQASELELLGARGEALLLTGLQQELESDRRAAAASYAIAEEDVTHAQPPSRALALTCEAQLLDAMGRPDDALARLREAATITEVRRNALPFLGWSRLGTPIERLLSRLDSQVSNAWVHELAEATSGKPDIAAIFAPLTATPRERGRVTDPTVIPSLSAREREVLNELARGATYADIAADLFVSENTVKTHVSSLYSKLAVTRRSEALAVARNLHLL